MFDEIKQNIGMNNPQEFGLIRAGVILAVFTFVVVITYFALSTPLELIYDGFDTGNMGAAESAMDTYLPIIRTATTLFFCILISLPVTWFVFWVFHREPSYQRFDPRQYR